jgi:hypothetical protein
MEQLKDEQLNELYLKVRSNVPHLYIQGREKTYFKYKVFKKKEVRYTIYYLINSERFEMQMILWPKGVDLINFHGYTKQEIYAYLMGMIHTIQEYDKTFNPII